MMKWKDIRFEAWKALLNSASGVKDEALQVEQQRQNKNEGCEGDGLFASYLLASLNTHCKGHSYIRFFTMDVTQLQMQLCDHQNAMIEQGLVNREFLELVRDLDSTMILAKKIDKSLELLNSVLEALEMIPANFEAVHFYARLNKRLTTRLCAAKAKNIWLLLKDYSRAHDLEKCVGCFQQLQDEYSLLKDNLERLITLQREIAAFGVSVPTLE